MAQNWLNNDGLFLQYGTDKAVSELGGEFCMPGPNRIIEARINLTSLGTSASSIISNTTIFPAPPAGQMFIEKCEIVVETGATSGGSATLNVGLIQMDRSTVPSGYGTAFVSGEVLANLDTAGTVLVYDAADSLPAGSTHRGGLLGSQPAAATGPYYLTAEAGTAVFTAGSVVFRVYYRGIGTITQ